jgi:type IV fimbrial biogenesis protein FimT
MLTRPRAGAAGGFSLLELMTVLAIMTLLLLAAMPSFSTWVSNIRVRAVADDLQNALRTAQSEAVRRSRQVVFVRTSGATGSVAALTASASGTRWAIVALPLSGAGGEQAVLVESGALTDVAGGVNVSTGPSVLCFNSAGRLTANASLPITGSSCTVDSGSSDFDISANGSDKPLKVTVAVGGQVRLCDPAFTLSTNTPYGCP